MTRAFSFLDSLPWRFFKKLALLQIIVTIIVIVITALTARNYLRTYMMIQTQEFLADSLDVIEKDVTSPIEDYQSWCDSQRLTEKIRVTLIGMDGTVRCDNYRLDKGFDNHLYRPEIQQAIESQQGSSSRYSISVGKNMVYVARLLRPTSPDPVFLRVSMPTQNIDEAMQKLDRSIYIFIFPIFLITTLMSLYASLQVSSPLSSLLEKVERMKKIRAKKSSSLVDKQSDAEDSDEWEILERTLDRAKDDLESYINELFIENEKINTLMESISDCLFAINLDHSILFANGQFKKNFLKKDISQKDLNNYKFWEILRDQDISELFVEVLKTQEPRKSRNHLLTVKDGKAQSYYDLTISPLKNNDNTIMGAVCVLHNVTDRKTAEQLREDFVANVSHEVRTPLTALKGYVQMLGSFLEENQIEQKENWDIFIKRIEWNSERLAHLFNDILQLSVIESKRKVEKESVSTEDITTHAIANLKQSYQGKSIEIETFYNAPNVHAHPQLLEQVITNLLDNAFKYSPQNSKIQIRWDQENDHICLCVCDNGESIAEKHHARLFERFYRVDPSRSREQGGTGLGLAIVKHIVQKHLGSVHYEAPSNGGNKFIVKLPLGLNKPLNS